MVPDAVTDPDGPVADSWPDEVARAIAAPAAGTVWIDLPQGPVAAGALVGDRLEALLDQGVRGDELLVLVPQRPRRRPDPPAAQGPGGRSAVSVERHTFYGLASRMVRLFWPRVAAEAGFGAPLEPPVLLTYETAQYVMKQVVDPVLGEGAFDGLSLRPQRLLSQLLDNLNKAGVNGYDIAEVGPRLRDAWTAHGEGREAWFDQAQTCIEGYRAHCLAHNLVDVSLVLHIFHRNLLPCSDFLDYLDGRFRHLLVEAVEETVPLAQDFIRQRLEAVDSALLVARRDGGFRVFLGVDPEGAWSLRDGCGRRLGVPDEPVRPTVCLGRALSARFEPPAAEGEVPAEDAAAGALRLLSARHRGQMVGEVAAEVVRLVAGGEAEPGEIAVVAPHADGVLRFLVGEALREARIPCAVVRRFESLREEPETRLALALAALAYPAWKRPPHARDVSEALQAALGLDAVRAHLLTRAAYDAGSGTLRELGEGDPRLRERLPPGALEAFESLRRWLDARRQGEPQPLDLFLRQLFGEVLSRPDLEPGRAAMYARLISSASWFRRSAPSLGAGPDPGGTAEGYARMVEEGVVAAAHPPDAPDAAPGAVLVMAPVYTYLLEERFDRYQFWLDAGSISWWEPPHQPLTNPHVLSRRWPREARWTDAVDYDTRNRTLGRLVRGLCSRAGEAVYLCWSETEGGGQPESDSPLLRAATQLAGPAEPGP